MRRRTMIAGGLAACLPVAARAADRPVVLELFTSQGCSSCPPADALLGELAQRPDVIALAWHVDYWNYLGWHDPYASGAWTARQRAYATRLGEEVYTPALVVDGSAMVVGSNRRAVTGALQAAAPLRVAVGLTREADALRVEFGAVPKGATALLVRYDPRNATPVGAGENAGRRLQEYRIVRESEALEPDGGVLRRPLPKPGQGAVLLLQDAELRVLGAADLQPA